MSRTGPWPLSVLSNSNTRQGANNHRDASVQTLLSASSITNVSKDWLFRKVEDEDIDIDFIANDCNDSDIDEESKKKRPKRRKRIPNKPHHPHGIWTILKNLIGQNLTNVALPVYINEPLTVLQRMTESFESSSLLDRAADCENVYDQMAFVAAFAITSYAVSAERNGKPFNPLLGETYECDRISDLGWKCLTEQVSHHPAVSALHCESAKWVFWEDLAADLYFRGKYIRIVPTDYRYVKFKSSQRTYRIERAETVIHNIVFGKIWIDHTGKVDIICLTNTAKCSLLFEPWTSFSRTSQGRVHGEVSDSSKVKRMIRGNWNEKIEIASNLADNNGEMSASTATYETVWERKPPKPESSKYYNFSEFACELNELEANVAPTDSRLRPDLRLMEEAKWDQADEVKLRLEEKQRQIRHQRERENAALLVSGNPSVEYNPTWFRKTPVASADQPIYVYAGGYWEAKRKNDWSKCPDIF